MRILLTNDDGIDAPGIRAAHDELVRIGEVFTIAPLTVQSATSHGVTFNEPLMIRDVAVSEAMEGVAVDGRPADCVKLAITSIWPERRGGLPDLVVSGINAGTNVGIHVIYSGTVAAAIEAAFLGIPSIALSLMIRRWKKTRFDVAARWAREVVEMIIAAGPLEPHTVINVNLPVCEEDAPTPAVRVVPMNLAAMRDRYDRRVNPSGGVYYWCCGDGLDFHNRAEGSDVEAVFEGDIAVTPLRYDLTRHDAMEHWRQRLEAGARVEPERA